MLKNITTATALLCVLLTSCSTSNINDENSTVKANSNNQQQIFTGSNSRLIGRFDLAKQGKASFTWPGSAIEFKFKGTQASIEIESQGKTRFQLNIDGDKKDLWTEPGKQSYLLATGLINKEHFIKLTRLNESTAGITSFVSDPIVDGKLLSAPEPSQRKLLVIGDSITAGYGVEGANQSCHYALDTSNQQLTYAALAANALGADLHVIAWSGIGAWRSYGEKTPNNPSILVRHTRILADDAGSQWNPKNYQPDAVLINIGTNDYWEGSVGNEYRDAMLKLITKTESDYPNKPIYLIVSPMLGNKVHLDQKQVLTSLANDRIKVFDLGENNGEEGFGCDYHPNKTTNIRLGKALESALKANLNW